MLDGPLVAGRHLGPFQLRRPLGRGGSGEVWEAVLQGPGGFRKPVALKVLRWRGDPTEEDRILREARLGARLQHPNIVSTLLVGRHDGRLCIALELVRGRSLSELLHTQGPFDARALLDVAEQAATALHHVHTFRHNGRDAGMIHRDIKPANLLASRSGVVKLADLGISLLKGESQWIAGTHGYMAPEHVRGHAEPRSDLFGLGATLYTLATRTPPFGHGEKATENILQAASRLRDPDFLAPIREVCPGLDDLVEACLQPSADDRPFSASRVAKWAASLRHRAPPGRSLRAMVADGAPDASSEPTSWGRSSTAPAPGTLRARRDRFVGRLEELDALRELARPGEWVVVLGPGGVGKTRLAMELGERLRRSLSGGVWAIDLTEARSATEVCGTVAATLGVHLAAAEATQQLGRILDAKGRCLVVLDNLEQCVEALRHTVDVWRHMAPEACFVGTSRVRPGLAGERVLSLGNLDRDAGIALFRDRATAPLTAADLEEVARLCADLEYMPLPLELAAARCHTLPVAAMRRRLSNRLLAGQDRGRAERHRSVQASLEWSWELLGEAAREGLAQLSVFEGAFDLAAAEAVLDTGSGGGPWALDVLHELVDASLVRSLGHRGRFALWAVVRAFARELLRPDVVEATEVRHGAHFARVDPMASAGAADNLRAACERAVARGDGEMAVSLLERAGRLHGRRGGGRAWMALCEGVLSLELSDGLAARALLQLGQSLQLQERGEDASRAARKGRERARAAGDRRTEGRLLSMEAGALRRSDHERDVGTLLEEALRAHQATGDLEAEAQTLCTLGGLHREGHRLIEARACAQAALAIAEGRGDGHRMGRAAVLLGNIEGEGGDLPAAEAYYRQAAEQLLAADDLRGAALVYANLATLQIMQGEMARALPRIEQALDAHRTLGSNHHELDALGNLALIHLTLGHLEAAHDHAEEALELSRRTRNRRGRTFIQRLSCSIHRLRGDLDAAREAVDDCLASAEATGDPRNVWRAHVAMVDVERDAARREAAWGHIEAARAAAFVSEEPNALAEVAVVRARWLLEGPSASAELAQVEALLDLAQSDLRAPSQGHTMWWVVRAAFERVRGRPEASEQALEQVAAQPCGDVDPRVLEAVRWVTSLEAPPHGS